MVSEIYADGWRAYVNGRRVEILPTHHALRGVVIPAGDATVEMLYEPLAIRVGVPVSAAAAFAVLAIFALSGRRRWLAFRRDRAAGWSPRMNDPGGSGFGSNTGLDPVKRPTRSAAKQSDCSSEAAVPPLPG